MINLLILYIHECVLNCSKLLPVAINIQGNQNHHQSHIGLLWKNFSGFSCSSYFKLDLLNNMWQLTCNEQ